MAGSKTSPSLASPQGTGGRPPRSPGDTANGSKDAGKSRNGSGPAHSDGATKMPGVNEQRRTPPSRGSASAPQHPVPTPSLRSSADFGFTGTFVSDDMEVTGSLQISPNRVILWASGSQLASWDVTECSVERRSVTKFEVNGGGESLTFTADDPTGLDEAISALAKSRVETRSRRRLSDVAPASPPVEKNTSEMVEAALAEPDLAETEAGSELPKEQREPPKPKRAPAARRSRTGSYQIPRSDPEAPVTPPKEPEAPVTPREPDAPVSRRPRIKNFQAAQSEAEPSSRTKEAPVSRERLVARPAEDEEEEETIADEAIALSTGTRIRAARWLRSDMKEMGIKVAAVALASILLGGFAYSIYVLAGGTGYEPEVFVQDPTTSIPPRPSTTVPISSVVTAPVPPTTLFETDPAQLTERWNVIAEASSRPDLVLLRDLTSPVLVSVTPFITLEGVLDPNAGYLTMRSTPTATPEGDGAILSSLGMVVAMSDPSLKPVDRRLLLEALGLDVRDPQLAGIDASLNYNGLTYRLTYFQDQNLLEFAITPEVPVATTTTAP